MKSHLEGIYLDKTFPNSVERLCKLTRGLSDIGPPNQMIHTLPLDPLIHNIQWIIPGIHNPIAPTFAMGGGRVVFRGGYYAWVWPLKMNPKLGFWIDSKSHPKQGFWQIVHTPNWEFSNSANYHTLIKDMGSKTYPNPMFIVSKKHTRILHFLLAWKHTLFLDFYCFWHPKLSHVVRASPWKPPFLCVFIL